MGDAYDILQQRAVHQVSLPLRTIYQACKRRGHVAYSEVLVGRDELLGLLAEKNRLEMHVPLPGLKVVGNLLKEPVPETAPCGMIIPLCYIYFEGLTLKEGSKGPRTVAHFGTQDDQEWCIDEPIYLRGMHCGNHAIRLAPRAQRMVVGAYDPAIDCGWRKIIRIEAV